MNLILFFYFGCILGSFFQSLNSRMASQDSLTESQLNVRSFRSNCDKCGHQLSIIDLIPIISFLYLKGRCRFCDKKIEVQNLTAEVIFGFVFLFLSFNSFNTFDLAFDKDGNSVTLDQSKIDAARTTLNAEAAAIKYQTDRTTNGSTTYDSYGNQLDMIYKDLVAGKFDTTGTWATHIKAVKDANPKP